MPAGFDSLYQTTGAAFGSQPEEILTSRVDLLPLGGRVLDVGAGQGRNALFLGRRGFAVDAIDPSTLAVEHLRRTAARERLPLAVECCRFEDYRPRYGGYAAVLVFGLLPILEHSEIGVLRSKIEAWGAAGTLVFLTAFSTADPGYAATAARGEEIGRHSFRSPGGEIRTYFEPGEVTRLFAGHEMVHHWEGLGPEHRHGDGPLHRHGWVEIVVRLTPASGTLGR